MQKDFDKWNEDKKKIHNRLDGPFFHDREIWWCSLGLNIGFEQDGSGESYYRPVLVLKAMSKQTCFIIPLTTSGNQHPLRPSIGIVEGKQARALLSQMRLIDAKRFVRKAGYLDKEIYEDIRKTVKNMF
jgi:mRNA-degrading endonuclease toxin of MazEF toxin-antitoxin module